MPSLVVSPEMINSGGSAVVEVMLEGGESLMAHVELFRRSDGSKAATGMLTVNFPTETVGLATSPNTTYILRVDDPSISLEQTGPTTFRATHNP